MKEKYEYVWFWNPKPPPGRYVDRKGDRCRVVARGAMNTILVEFVDGFRVTTSRNAVRKIG